MFTQLNPELDISYPLSAVLYHCAVFCLPYIYQRLDNYISDSYILRNTVSYSQYNYRAWWGIILTSGCNVSLLLWGAIMWFGFLNGSWGSAFKYACILIHTNIWTPAFVLSAVTKSTTVVFCLSVTSLFGWSVFHSFDCMYTYQKEYQE